MIKSNKKTKDELYLEGLGKKIRDLRKLRNMTQIQIAEELDTHYTQVGRIERGQVNSTINMIRRIAEILKIKISDLVNVQ